MSANPNRKAYGSATKKHSDDKNTVGGHGGSREEYSDRQGGSRGQSSRGASEGSRGGFSSRGGSSSRGEYSPRGGGESFRGGYGSRGGFSSRGGGYRGDSRGGYPSLPRQEAAPRSATLVTNNFPIKFEKEVIIYRYDVQVQFSLQMDDERKPVKIIELTKEKEATKLRRQQMSLLMKDVLGKHDSLLGENGGIVYDGDMILLTNEDIAAKMASPHIQFPVEQLSAEGRSIIRSTHARDVIVTIKPCADSSARFTIAEEMKSIQEGNTDRPLRQFLELLTTQTAVDEGTYLVVGGGRLFSKERFAVIQGVFESRNSVMKGTSIVQTEKGIGAHLTQDVGTATCYKGITLVEVAQHLNGRPIPQKRWDERLVKNVSRFIKGRKIQLKDDERVFEAHCMINRSIGDLVDECKDAKTGEVIQSRPSLERFAGKLTHLDWPSVQVLHPGGVRYLPVELLSIADDQPVPMRVLQENEIQPSPVLPNDRFNRIKDSLGAMGLTGHEKDLVKTVLKRFGVSVDINPVHVDASYGKAPDVVYANNRTAAVDPVNVNWRTRGTKYEVAGKVDYLLFAYNSRIEDTVRKFCDAFLRCAEEKGVQIGKCEIAESTVDLEKEIEKKTQMFSKVATKGETVAIIYIDPKKDKTHGFLKLLERKYEVITQHITKEIAYKATTNTPAMENIMSKFNCKTFGLNYSVRPQKAGASGLQMDCLIIGVDVAHPTGQSAGDRSLGWAPEFPSVVGWSANCLGNVHQFIGDFHYQTPRQEKIDEDIIMERMKWTLQMFKEYRNGKLPRTIYIFRDGISEGQYEMAVKEELSAFKNALKAVDPKHKADFVLVVATKRHNHRFFQEVNGEMRNPNPLVVITGGVIQKDVEEFFCQSHKAIIGTAKATAYQVLRNETKLTQAHFVDLVFALCFEHQISTSPISIPEPVFMADEWAKRGNDLYKAYQEFYPLDRVNGTDDRRVEIDWTKMTTKLCYMNTKLACTRVNA